MNSLIQVSQGPLSVAPERLSSASRLHVSLSHGSLSVSQWCKPSQLCSRPLYVKCTLDRFSEGSKMKDENGKKSNIVRGAGRASLVLLACVLGALALSGKIKMNLKPNIAHAGWFDGISRKKSFSKSEHLDANQIKDLKSRAMALSVHEESKDEAVRMMSEQYERFKDTPDEHLLLVALIEVLLHQKKYEEAKKKIQELLADIDSKGGMFDVDSEKIYRLKAIAESQGDPKKARELWEQYQEGASSSPYSVKR